MKQFIPLLMFVILSCNSSRNVDEVLKDVWKKDQDIRYTMMALTNAVIVEGRTDLIDSLLSASEQMEEIDANNMKVVDKILNKGLPADLTDESYKTIWIVIDHSTLEKQLKYLPVIEKMALSGKVDMDEYAVLYDRILMKQNLPQRYGTQSVQFGNQDSVSLYIWPVENHNSLDSIRESVGMSTIDEYLKDLSEATGVEAKYDYTLSIDQINQLRGNDTHLQEN